MKKSFLILMALLFTYSAHATCPKIYDDEIPQGSTPSGSGLHDVKRLNINYTENFSTIFFCKEPRDSSHTTLNFSKSNFIDAAGGVDSITMGNAEKTVPIGTSVVSLSNNATVGNYLIAEQESAIIATKKAKWNEYSLFHFYKRRPRRTTCTWENHRDIRNYLRDHPEVFTLSGNNASPVSDSTKPWSIAKITDAKLSNVNGKEILADIDFYWLQNRDRGGGQGTGGYWDDPFSYGRSNRYRYCHFAVATEFKLKTNALGTAYNIDEAGSYSVDVGVRTVN